MPEVPVFISEAVLARVRDGSFTPARRVRRESNRGPDRRRVFSPLAVTRRCVRYDPNVFTHRREQILQAAEALNTPDIKMLLLSGLQGAGKTSMLRGVIELMGGNNEQLLWFDVNRHTDFEEIIHFLIQYISYIAQSLRTAPLPSAPGQREPLRELEALILDMADVPLLIVLDNVEYIVDSDFRFNSYPFKEMLNFLLGFPNIKMVLIGERLPYADISPNQPGVLEIRLAELSPQSVVEFLSRKTTEPLDTEVLARLCDKSLGMPWLLKLLYYLNQQLALHVVELERHLTQGQPLIEELTEYIWNNLSQDERWMFQTLALLRHPVNAPTLQALTRRCFPGFDPGRRMSGARSIEESFIRPVLKISFPPQQVLAEIRENLDRQASGFTLSGPDQEKRRHEPWYELYRQVKKLLYAQMPDLDRIRLHGVLQDFYLEEKNRPVNQRISHIKSRALLSEAKHHSQAARKRRESVPGPGVGVQGEGSPSFLTSPSVSPESRAYLDSMTPPLSAGKAYTLEDYRQWNLGGEPSIGEASLTLDGLELTEEERLLLYGENPSPGPGPVSPASLPSVPQESVQPSVPIRDTPADLESLYADSARQEADQPVEEAEKPLLETLSAAVVGRNKTAFARALLALGQHRLERGHLTRAEECLRKVEGLRDSLEPPDFADLYRLQGKLYKETFRHNEAESALLRAAESVQRAEIPDAARQASLGDIYQNLGEIAAYRGQHARALEVFGKALLAYPDPARQAEIHFAMAGVHDEAGQPDEALRAYCQSLALEPGDDLACAATLANMGGILLELERFEEAEAAFEESLSHDRKANHPQGQIKTLESLAMLHWMQGEPGRAEINYQQALVLALREGVRLWQANLYLKLGDLYAEQGDWRQARLQYERARSSAAGELSDSSLQLIESKIQEVYRESGTDENRAV